MEVTTEHDLWCAVISHVCSFLDIASLLGTCKAFYKHVQQIMVPFFEKIYTLLPESLASGGNYNDVNTIALLLFFGREAQLEPLYAFFRSFLGRNRKATNFYATLSLLAIFGTANLYKNYFYFFRAGNFFKISPPQPIILEEAIAMDIPLWQLFIKNDRFEELWRQPQFRVVKHDVKITNRLERDALRWIENNYQGSQRKNYSIYIKTHSDIDVFLFMVQLKSKSMENCAPTEDDSFRHLQPIHPSDEIIGTIYSFDYGVEWLHHYQRIHDSIQVYQYHLLRRCSMDLIDNVGTQRELLERLSLYQENNHVDGLATLLQSLYKLRGRRVRISSGK